MRKLAFETLRARKGNSIAAFVTHLCAAALAAACGGLLESVSAATSRPRGTPIPTPAYGDSLGHGWGTASLAPFTLAEGSPPASSGDVVVDARIASISGLRVGDTARIQTAAGSAPYIITGITRQQLPHQRFIFFTDLQANTLADHPGMVYAIGLPGATNADMRATGPSRTRQAQTYSPAPTRERLSFRGAAKSSTTLISLGAVLGGTSLLIAILVVSGTLALSIGQREREPALFRALGATPSRYAR